MLRVDVTYRWTGKEGNPIYEQYQIGRPGVPLDEIAWRLLGHLFEFASTGMNEQEIDDSIERLKKVMETAKLEREYVRQGA